MKRLVQGGASGFGRRGILPSKIQESSRVGIDVGEIHSGVESSGQVVRPATLFPFIISLLWVFLCGETARAQLQVELSRIGDATHLEFTGASEWKYTLKRDAEKSDRVTLRLRGLRPEAAHRLKAMNDSLIKGVQVDDQAIDESTEVTFQVSANADFFDYISDQPSRLIIDFFPKDDAPKAKPEVKKSATNAANTEVKKNEAAGKLPEKTKVAAKPKTPSPAAKDDDDQEEDDGDAVADNESYSGRRPAGTDLAIANVQKSVLPPAPSLAEKISSKKDFQHGIFDGGDPEFRRFMVKDYEFKEESVIASRANFYLPFPMLELGNPQLKAIFDAPPIYEIVANETRENKEARVLLQLFSNKQRALFLKTASEFLANYPNGKYDEIVRYMVADAHYDIWRGSASVQDFETAMNHYLALAEKYPESPMTPRTLLLMGYSYVDRGDSFGALKVFQRFVRQSPNSKQGDRVQISIAEAYLKLNRFDDALQLLDQIEKNGKTQKGREEAAFRKGDVFFRKKDFANAAANYRGAVSRLPAAESRFPNAWYNIAESEFNLKKYRESLESYRQFLQKFPDHEHGGYAMTRMGELLGILGAGPSRAGGAFRESFFRYRATPGAGVARIRLLASRMPEMKEKELSAALSEIDEITKRYSERVQPEQKVAKAEAEKKPEKTAEEPAKPAEGGHEGGASAGGHEAGGHEAVAEVDEKGPLKRLTPKEGEDPTRKRPVLPGIDEFSELLISDGHTMRGEYDTATKKLISYYQKNPTSPNLDKFKTRIVNNISDSIHTAVGRGDFLDALRRYSKNTSGWLKNNGRIDLRYDIGRAYEQAGVFKEAETTYNEALTRLNAIKGKKEEREFQVFEKLPKEEQIELRLAAVKAKDDDFAGAEAHLKKIQKVAALTPAEQIERAEVSAQVAEARGQTDAARKYLEELIAAWQAEPQLTSPLHLRIARLQEGARNYKVADQHLAKIIEWRKQDEDKVSDEVHAQALELRADIAVKRGRRSEAVKLYTNLLETYEPKRPLASVRYRLGQVLYQNGDLKGAETTWGGLKGEKDGLWQRLASEQMQGAKWQNEYKKYLNRIPAAADLRDESSDAANE